VIAHRRHAGLRLVFCAAVAIAACAETPPAIDLGRDLHPPDLAAIDVLGDAKRELGVPTPDTGSCAPLPATPTLSLFTQLQTDLVTLQGAARQTRVDAFFAAVALGSYPLRDATNVVFLYRGSSTAVTVGGTFNGWSSSADALQVVAGTDLRYLVKAVGGARHEYKLVVDGKTWLRDMLSPHVTWDGIPRNGIGELNSVLPPWGAPDPKGRIEWRAVPSPQLSNTRDVFVYLPPGYDDDRCARYPLLLINDGNESLTRSHFDAVAATTFGAKKSKPAILAFVALADQNDRMSEYSCETTSQGPSYTDFLCDTLVPLLDKSFRTDGLPSRGIIGASMGGLISYAALFWRNDCLRRVGGQSSSFWYADDMMIKRVQSSTGIKLAAAYLDNGTDNRDGTLAMRDALKAKGYNVIHVENLAQDHTWEAWADRFDEALAALYPP
jgi:predicted alpha/beta superfamily hydrolase